MLHVSLFQVFMKLLYVWENTVWLQKKSASSIDWQNHTKWFEFVLVKKIKNNKKKGLKLH